MEALGESDASNPGFHFDHGGISIDIGKEISTNFVFSVSTYVQEAVSRFGEDNTQLQPLFLFGDKELFEQSQSALPRLTEAQLKPVLSRTARILSSPTSSSAASVAAAAAARPATHTKIDLKAEYLHPMIWAITQLGLYHGLPQDHSSHPLDILTWLGNQEILDLAFVKACEQALL